jgi:hypothetical protein
MTLPVRAIVGPACRDRQDDNGGGDLIEGLDSRD